MSELAESEHGEALPVQVSTPARKSRRRVVIFCVASVVNIGLLAFILMQLLTPAARTTPADPLVGHAAPQFSLTLLQAEGGQSTLALSSLKGKAVVLNFWASWCAPCKEEMPLLEQSWQQMQAQGSAIVFLGVDFQETGNAPASFVQQHGISYPIGLDTNGTVALQYNITALPQTVFITKQGTVASRVQGELTSQTLASNLKLIV